jgi:3-oxoadipate CoA-transferase, beta subunit
MMRGGHLDVCVLGAFHVSDRGDLANWHTGAPGAIPAAGGAMDLAIGAKSVFVTMTLFAKDWTAKLVPRCTYPLTGVGCVDRIYTDYATIMINSDGAVVTETFGASVAELQARVKVTVRAPSQASSGR